jgi:hypothetical protein
LLIICQSFWRNFYQINIDTEPLSVQELTAYQSNTTNPANGPKVPVKLQPGVGGAEGWNLGAAVLLSKQAFRDLKARSVAETGRIPFDSKTMSLSKLRQKISKHINFELRKRKRVGTPEQDRAAKKKSRLIARRNRVRDFMTNIGLNSRAIVSE